MLTSLTREAMPLLRYRTRDLTCFREGEGPCGNRHRRLARLRGRLAEKLRAELLFKFGGELPEPHRLSVSERKAVRVLD